MTKESAHKPKFEPIRERTDKSGLKANDEIELTEEELSMVSGIDDGDGEGSEYE
jgi:hypothetical protein